MDKKKSDFNFRKYIKARKRDLILGGSLLLLAAVLLLILFFVNRKDGQYLVVKYQGKLIGAYRLDVDQTPDPITNYYEGMNQIVIKDGAAHMESANCKKSICMHMGSVSKVGEIIICLPNELILTVTDSVEGSVKILGEQ